MHHVFLLHGMGNSKSGWTEKPKGVSLVTTVSDNATSRLAGHGIQIQLGKYALAVTSHGGKPALTFSMDLLGRLNEVDKELSDRLKALQ